MIALARCSKLHRIIIAGEKSIELMFELDRWGYARVATTANCGRPAEQYEVALIDWRKRTLRSLEGTPDWLGDLLDPDGVIVVWSDRQKAQAREGVNTALEKRGFSIEATTVRADGSLVSARRRDVKPIPKAA